MNLVLQQVAPGDQKIIFNHENCPLLTILFSFAKLQNYIPNCNQKVRNASFYAEKRILKGAVLFKNGA